MKTIRFALLATFVTGSAALLTAGPGPQFWVRPPAPKTAAAADTKVAVAAAQQPAAPAAAACAACSTGSCCKKG